MSINLNDANLYINRELSWLQFNSRVLAQTKRETLPALEKLKFIAIYGTNLDEFYMVRVAGLISLEKAGIQETGPDKLTPSEQLKRIRAYLHKEKRSLEKSYLSILSELNSHNLFIKSFDKLDEKLKESLKERFFEEIYPVIIPIAIDATHPFPHLNNLSFGLAVKLSDMDGNIKHGLVRIPRVLARFIKVEDTYIPIESVVEHFIGDLFPGYTKIATTPFRVTRNADMEIEEEEADDFLEMMEESLRSRNKGNIVRLELTGDADEDLVEFLNSHLQIDTEDIYYYRAIPLNLGALWQIVGEKSLSHLLLPSYTPKILPPFDREEIFSAMENQDVVLYHPYESFDPVVKFIQQSASDPNTLAIRMTLYRVGSKSPIVKALIDAALDGKQVTVLVELKARFDEENNLKWAKRLEEAGAHVIYGIPGMKVHAKIAQVIRKKQNRLKSYLHLATGNYNPTTAKIYTDLSYFTTNKDFNNDATRFFHFLTGFSTNTVLKNIYMSPTQIRNKLLDLISREANYGENGHIILKSNSLTHPEIIQALYKASIKGCRVDLIIRGICCLKSGIEGVSENIRVHSIIGKYLEHPRVYWFKNDSVRCYISSADLMPRNLDRRVELMTPVIEDSLKERIEQILTLQLGDNTLRWVLNSDGSYTLMSPRDGERVINSQELLEKYINKIYQKNKKRDNSSNYVKKLADKLLQES